MKYLLGFLLVAIVLLAFRENLLGKRPRICTTCRAIIFSWDRLCARCRTAETARLEKQRLEDTKRQGDEEMKRAAEKAQRRNAEERARRDEWEAQRRADAARQEEERKRQEQRDAYEVLGISRAASEAEIRAAYKRESLKYHPDRVSHLGEEFKVIAEKKMREINRAFERLSGK